MWLQSVISNPHASESLREHLGRLRGGENLEFLLAYCHFEKSRNPLQRFQQLRSIVHRYLRDNAERPVQLSEKRRVQVLREWDCRSGGSRFSAEARLPGLEEAAAEIHELIVKQGGPLGAGDLP